MSSKNKVTFLEIKCALFIVMLFCSISIGAAKEPFDSQAGLTAYVNVGSGVNIDTASGAYDYTEEISGSHALGTINIENAAPDDYYGLTSDKIHVYVDTNGWIAAYLTRDQNVGSSIQYADIDYANPVVHTTLEDAIRCMCEELDISYDTVDDNIKFYDFEFPEATDLMIAVKVIPDAVTVAEDMDLLIPSTNTVYQGCFGLYHPGLVPDRVCINYDGSQYMSASPNRRSHGEIIPVSDVLHKITIYNWNGYFGSKGTGTILLVYK